MNDSNRLYASIKTTFQQATSRFGTLSPRKKIILLIVIICFGLFAWPTLYRYDKVVLGERTSLVRTNRITGKTEILTSAGTWFSQKPPVDKSKIISLPQNELYQIQGNGGIQNEMGFHIDWYNGSKWTIKEITIKLTIYNKDKTLRWSRLFRSDVEVKPLTSNSDYIEMSDVRDVESFEWNLEDVKGYIETE